MQIIETVLRDVKLISPAVFEDSRGHFFESWNSRAFAALRIDAQFVQDNQSCSSKGVLRGLHYQVGCVQGKLIRVVAGAAFDVAVDLRASSPTFGQWVGVHLSAANKNQLWIPQGFAHGFLSLTEGTELVYKCTDFYSAQDERCIVWDDPTIGIIWPLKDIGMPLLSAKDQSGKSFEDSEKLP